MGSQWSKCSEGNPSSGTLAGFISENFGPLLGHLTKSAKLTKSGLKLQWLLWGTLDLPKLFLKTKLEDFSSKIKQNEWYVYFNWYLEASKCVQNFKTASLQETVSKLTKTTKKLREQNSFWSVMLPSPFFFISGAILFVFPDSFVSGSPLRIQTDLRSLVFNGLLLNWKPSVRIFQRQPRTPIDLQMNLM